ncbi:F-box protein-like protein [Drosera capensis]
MAEKSIGEEQRWRQERITKALSIASTVLPQRDLITLLLLTPSLHRTLLSYPSLWQVIDLREKTKAGDRLVAAVALPRYSHVRQINLEFGQDVEDKHLELIKSKYSSSLQHLDNLNLNGCQKISDKGVEAITRVTLSLKIFSIYWNVRITDVSIQNLVKNCKNVIDLNLSGCKNITDHSMQLIADNYQDLESLNITRCIRINDFGLDHILNSCSSLQNLNLYALSRFTDKVYTKISLLPHLRVLDLCGAQNLSDEGLASIAKCKKLVSLNLTWCIRITDAGVLAMAQNCTSLNLLSLFGIVGVTDKSLEALSRSCGSTLETLDVNGCINIKVMVIAPHKPEMLTSIRRLEATWPEKEAKKKQQKP